eukprot:TRINITY_DN24258_c0_g1_i1.p1 TRINITY_DN24258_c0_g1~~TRINITY_DN24258_c0_g1_i1.p1  ORF type:complete len:365 (-),score=54.65 TRINITY_DN24258_c0_g1_i1:180-1274(-)
MTVGDAAKPEKIRPAGLQVEIFNDHVFSELRAQAQVPDDFLDNGWSLDELVHGGGKGGSLMAFVGDSFIVKECNKGDHKMLLLIADSYKRHVLTGDTLLCPIYLHFKEFSTGRIFFAMRNSIGQGPFKALYDLKGCADDKTLHIEGKPIPAVHKRIWKVGMWCCHSTWSDNRKRYFQGKLDARKVQIVMTHDQRESFVKTLKRDTDWLASHQLMDYSLLVAIKEAPSTSNTSNGVQGRFGSQPLRRKLADGSEIQLYISIIDFLQIWTCGKNVARCIKVLERNKATIPPCLYAERFSRHFASRTMAAKAEPEAPDGNIAQPSASSAVRDGGSIVEGLPEERLMSRPLPTNYGRYKHNRLRILKE